MTMLRRPGRLLVGASLLALFVSAGAANAQDTDPAQLQRLIQAQQRQIEAQQRSLRELQRQMDALQRSVELAQQAAGDAKVAAAASDAKAQATQDAVAANTKAIDDADALAIGKSKDQKSAKVKVTLAGQVNRMINLASDGDRTRAYFVDNNVSNSRVAIAATGKIDEKSSVGGLVEIAVSPNNSTAVNQNQEDLGSDSITDRKVEAYYNHDDYGRVTIGKGSMATDSVAENDISGTSVVAYATVSDLAGGLLFRNSDTGELTNVTVGNVFSSFDGGRLNRVRYDSPNLYGFGIALAAGTNNNNDVALSWKGELGDVKGQAAVGYAPQPGNGLSDRVMGSVSFMHVPTGLSLTASTGTQDKDGVGSGKSYYLKGGWQTQFLSFGKTAFSLDAGYDEDINAAGDEAWTVGLYAVQTIADYGTDLYAGVRNYSLDTGAGQPSVDDILVGTFGARIKF